jgi:hypothetical protein
MVRVFLMLAIVLGSLLLAPTTAATQEATPDASPMAAGGLLDLPALVLSPADLDAAGWSGYGESVGYLAMGPEAVADAFVGGVTTDEEARITDELRAAGVERFYASWLAETDPETGETTREVLS